MSTNNASGLNNVLLCQRKSNQEKEDEQKQIKPASDKLGLSGTRILFFHNSTFATQQIHLLLHNRLLLVELFVNPLQVRKLQIEQPISRANFR